MAVDRVPASWGSLLRDRMFGPYFFGKLLASSGVWLFATVAGIVTFRVHGSALDVGIVGAAQFTPQVLLGPWSGALADRGHPVRQLAAGWVLAGVSAAAAGVALALGDGHTFSTITPALIASAGVGLGMTIGAPAMQVLVPALVDPEDLPTAISLDVVPMVVARALGPAVGGAVVVALDAPLGFAAAASGCAVFVACLAFVRIARTHVGRDTDGRVWSGVTSALRDPVIRSLLLCTTAVGVASDPPLTLAPSLSQEFVGDGSLVGALTSSFGVGSVVGLCAVGPFRRRFGLPGTTTAGVALLAAGLLIAGALPSVVPVMGGYAVTGCGMTVALVASTTLLQQHITDDVRGRVMALWLVAFSGSRPAAGALDGAVADLWSTQASNLVMGAGVGLALWWARPGRTAPSEVQDQQRSAAA